jgi:maltooligosyltrehalose trehalohydrolase
MNVEDLRPLEDWGHDAMWLDSLHHHLHVLLTGETTGYFKDFGSIDGVVRELARERPERFVVAAQNHDQVGNRARGERLPELTGAGGPEVAAAAVLLSPFVPRRFMGEEYGDPAPFPYFVSHSDPQLVAAVRAGRAAEFADLVGVDTPDPQDPATFASAVLTRGLATQEPHRRRLAWYRALLHLRASHPALRDHELHTVRADVQGEAVVVQRGRELADLVLVLHFGAGAGRIPLPDAALVPILDSGATEFAATGAAVVTDTELTVHGLHAVVLARDGEPGAAA